MRTHRCSWLPLLVIVTSLAGCSTINSRFGGTPQSRSIAVVGDRPQPATTGEPGGQVVADVPQSEPKTNPKTRISGRVVDEQGEPVSNVVVRLADGGTKGGKDIQGTTDRSGGFSLNGLRPGSTYWLIAESEDSQGPLTGRVQAKTADTRVEISLGPEGSATSGRSRTTRPSRVRPISSREGRDPIPAGDEEMKVNHEDLLPSAEDPGSLDPGPPPTRSRRPQLSTPEPTVGWRNSNTPRMARAQDDEIVTSSATEDLPQTRRFKPVNPSTNDEDGPNPLPPAIDPGATANPNEAKSARPTPVRPRSSQRLQPRPADPEEMKLGPEARQPEARDPIADRGLALAGRPRLPSTGQRPSAVPVVEEGPAPMPAIGTAPVASTETPPPSNAPPGLASARPNLAPNFIQPASKPAFSSESAAVANVTESASPGDYNPFAIVAANNPEVAPPAEDSSAPLLPDSVGPVAATATVEAATISKVAEPGKAKWGDLAATDRTPEPAEATKAPGPVARRARGAADNRDTSVALCSYDPKLQRLKDFRLPDLEGKPVRFQDLDADYVLLDFWGTWCAPCLDTIPHLIALQKKYGMSRLRVVGIACEEVAPERRQAKVEEVARKLGINYAILLSSMDGKPCPVQQSLGVQAMPTMILVDRRGKVVWRNTGTTPASQIVLDRVLASSMSRSEATVRR